MLEHNLRAGLESATLDLIVCANGSVTLAHLSAGLAWEARLLARVEAMKLEFRALREDFEEARSNWGRDYGDEHHGSE